ncbi:MAG: polymer-forming cytoskeletal protein [Synechococcales cyanobacterium C42_A2020_086]|jgi:cytoskeletal protein CcmA (bactofilin family)|nr:polymer-forming cytoskeletal protein [Synechococcales cyanobacterium C42_A2020_086]
MFKSNPTRSLTYLSTTTELSGTLHVEGNLRIDGIIHGTVEVRGDIEISHTGLVEGPELKANNIVVHGVVQAHVTAEGKLTLTRKARLEGNVTAHSVDIEEGAFYVGHIATKDAKALPASSMIYPELTGQEESMPFN